MADAGELKEVKKVLIGPLLANNPITLLTTLIWYGWGKGKYINEATGKRRRYLMSARLRTDLLVKLCIQYPACMAVIRCFGMKRIIQKRKMSKFGPLFQKAAVLFHDF